MQNSDFEPRLESMRGAAALIVAVHHGITTFVGSFNDLGSVLGPLFWVLMERLSNPGAAVLFFFVLSGYVLGQSIERDSNYLRFIIRRTFRILPAFVAAVLFGYFCIAFARIDVATPGLSAFYKQNFWPELSLVDLRDTLLFYQSRADGPTWSIYWEIVGSLFLPALVIVHKVLPRRFAIPLFVLASTLILTRGNPNIRIMEYFYAGYALPPMISALLPAFWIVRFCAFVAGYALVLVAGPAYLFDTTSIIATSLGAALMIAAVRSSQVFFNWLRSPPMRFLGRVSYSFYLLHFPVFYLTSIAVISTSALPRNMIGNFAIAIISIGVALALSWASYAAIERPAINVGKRIADHIGRMWRSRPGQLYCPPVAVAPATDPGK